MENINYWVEHSNLFSHQIFMIVMGALYAMSFVLGVSYKAVNIYCYFVFYPASFALFLKSPIKYLILLSTLLFFLVPGFESISSNFFDECVVFLNYSARVLHSNYINMSIYLCVVVPLLLYIPFYLYKFGKKVFFKTLAILTVITIGYLLVIYPFFKPLLVTLLNLR
jgi:hypothetical protein